MVIAALFLVAKTWKQTRCVLVVEWVSNLCYIWAIEYYFIPPSNRAVAWACADCAGRAPSSPCPLLEMSASNQQWAKGSAIRTRSQKCPASRSWLCDFMGTSWKPVAHWLLKFGNGKQHHPTHPQARRAVLCRRQCRYLVRCAHPPVP